MAVGSVPYLHYRYVMATTKTATLDGKSGFFSIKKYLQKHIFLK